ncbi:MAG TPA: hypothetical protein PLX06_13045, partial [Fimbriimonadaceae bacterium]|nr:hypothetical protein [Fimbriimonadaceae bacterium]
LACVAGAFLSFKWLCRKGHQATREAAQKLEEAILGAAEELDVRNNLANASTPQSESESEVSVREES